MRIVAILYFLGLFVLMGSYVYFSTAPDTIRLTVATASEWTPEAPNLVRVLARDLSNGSRFENVTLRACWVSVAGGQDADPRELACTEVPFDVGGNTVVAVPQIPAEPVAGVLFELQAQDGATLKTAFLASDSMVVQDNETGTGQSPRLPGTVQEDIRDVFAPATFVAGVPNAVYVTGFVDGKPSMDTIELAQIYGASASFPKKIKPSALGVSRLTVETATPIDLEFRQGEHKMYATFLPNTKPIHVTAENLLLQSGDSIALHVDPVGSPAPTTVDIFVRNAWIAHRVYAVGETPRIEWPHEMKSPLLLYVYVSASDFASPDSSQAFAILASPKDMDIHEQARVALGYLDDDMFPEARILESRLSSATDNDLTLIRDYALARLASLYEGTIQTRLRTETEEALQFKTRKARHKHVANIILVGWFGLGVALFTGNIIMESRRRRRNIQEIGEESPTWHRRRIQIGLIGILVVGMFVLFYYMMQLL